MSLPIITLASSPTSANSKNLREPSFSSYLNGAEETLVLKLRGKTTQALDSSISIPQDHIFHRRNRTEDAEIDVFGAEKYFNDGLNHIPDIATKILLRPKRTKDDPAEIFASKEQHQITTSSIRSESSWISQSALLAAVSRNQQPMRRNKKGFLACIGCSCSCRDKNSVTVDVFSSESRFSKSTNRRNGKSRQRDKNNDHLVSNGHSEFNCGKFDELKVGRNSDGHFSFPVFNTKNGNQAANIQENDAMKRRSVEIFRSKLLENGKNYSSLEKKLSLSTRDGIAPGAAKIPSVSCHIDTDSDSDSCSDLFEIDSLSKGSIQASDNILSGCATPTACYAPSEASIEWSVITASAADFSILSDSEELGSTITPIPCPQKAAVNPKVISFKEIPKLRSGILSGCKSQKAVSVASNARKPSLPMTRFHDESKMKGFNARNRRQSFDARVLSQSRTGNAAHMLYT